MKKHLGPEWLKDAVFYQIYPSSFCDGNGDGMGDIPGIISKLDYLANLGVNAVWLSPCFRSPFADGGYDVSDYRHVAERFGTDDDLIRLFGEARKRGIRVCLDLVAGHTSIEHEWFKKSAEPEPNEYSDYYIWNNSWTGDTAGLDMIKGAATRDGCFAVNFFAAQPALNYGFARPNRKYPWQQSYRSPAALKVREELKNIMRFWLDRGASGFRVDMAPSLVKHDPGKKKTMELWQDIREMIDREYPDAALISEWSYAPQAIFAGFHCDFMIHCGTPAYTTLFRNEPERDIYGAVDRSLFYEPDGNDYRVRNRNSYFDASGKGSAEVFFSIWRKHWNLTRKYGYISIPTGNHDMPRISDMRGEIDLLCAYTFIMTMPGVPFIYYGDEIGMKNQPGLPSKEGGYTRTRARTPMQWDDSPNAGFSTAPAEKLYLPVDPDPNRPNAAEQIAREGSLWRGLRDLIALKHRLPGLRADADFEVLGTSYPTMFLRGSGPDRCLVVIQPADRPWERSIRLPFSSKRLIARFGKGIHVEIRGRDTVFSGTGRGYGIWTLRPVDRRKTQAAGI